jgi:hypothetical protein
MAYILVLLAPIKNPPLSVALLDDYSDQTQEARVTSRSLPAVVLTQRGSTVTPGPMGGTQTRTFTFRIRVLDRSPKDPEYPREASNARNVTAISAEVERLLATGKGRDLTRTTPFLWEFPARPVISDFDAWQGQPGQWSGRDLVYTASRMESWAGAANPQESFALPG